MMEVSTIYSEIEMTDDKIKNSKPESKSFLEKAFDQMVDKSDKAFNMVNGFFDRTEKAIEESELNKNFNLMADKVLDKLSKSGDAVYNKVIANTLLEKGFKGVQQADEKAFEKVTSLSDDLDKALDNFGNDVLKNLKSYGIEIENKTKSIPENHKTDNNENLKGH